MSGAIAERAKFEAYIFYSFFMAAWVYPVIVHASWSTSSYIGAFRCASILVMLSDMAVTVARIVDAARLNF